MPRQSLTKRKDGRYKVKYQGRQFYGATQAEAIQKREEYKQALRDGLQLNCPTVSSYAAAWLPAHKGTVSIRTYNAYAGDLDKFISMYGSVPLDEITGTMVKNVYTVKFSGYSESAIKKAKSTYTALFDSAVDDRYIKVNPCRGKTVKPHKGTVGTHRALTAEEDALILEVEHDFRPVVMLMRYAGLRRGEALALHVGRDIDFGEKIISVKNSVMYLSNQPIIKKPKSDAGIRTVPLFSILEKELTGVTGYAAKRKRQDGVMSASSFSSAWESYVSRVECHLNGYAQKRWYGNTKKDKALIASGGQLPPWKTFDIRPHDLRHSFCTMLRDAGVDMHIAIEWMGHEDEKMILEIYDHITDERRKKAVENVEKEMSRVQNGVQP